VTLSWWGLWREAITVRYCRDSRFRIDNSRIKCETNKNKNEHSIFDNCLTSLIVVHINVSVNKAYCFTGLYVTVSMEPEVKSFLFVWCIGNYDSNSPSCIQ